MKEGQTCIYYACGQSVEKIEKLPQTELVRDKGYEIESVFIDEQDVTNLVDKNGCLLLSHVYKSGNLRATFRFIRQEPEPNVPTGGRLPVAAAFLLLAGSGALAVAAGMKYRKQCS